MEEKNLSEFGELVKIHQGFFRQPSKLSRQHFCMCWYVAMKVS